MDASAPSGSSAPLARPEPPFATPGVPADPRLDALRAWLQRLPGQALRVDTLRPASSDASFRRYFRIDRAAVDEDGPTAIAMDAPPDREDCGRFIAVAGLLRDAGVNTPRILAADPAAGFLLLGDLGTTTYLDALAAGAEPDALYRDALDTLLRLQCAGNAAALPDYERSRFAMELQLFVDWYVDRHCGAQLAATERAGLERACTALIERALAQPRLFVHRDYHARNLMRTAGDNPGVLDFQDALHGPLTYDLVSLLRDAYVAWDEPRQLDWAIRYWEKARRARLPVADDFGVFWHDYEWMGLQRHLKILGIFARLYHRDGKDRYLADLPRVLEYARQTARRYQAMAPLARLLDRLSGVVVQAGYTF